MSSRRRIITIWQATYGQPNFLAVPTAGYLTPRRGSSIQPSIPAASAARFAGSKFTRGRATMISSTGKSTSRNRRSLGKGGRDLQTSYLIGSPRSFFENLKTCSVWLSGHCSAPDSLLCCPTYQGWRGPMKKARLPAQTSRRSADFLLALAH